MKHRTWIVFFCTQAVATALVVPNHFLPDRLAVLGYLLLLPGLAAVYGVVGNHFPGDKWDALFFLIAITLNAAVWTGIALRIRAIRIKTKKSN